MFEKVRSMVENSLVNKTPEQERMEKEIEVCEQELRRAGFEIESFIRLTSSNVNPTDTNNEKLGTELKRITENEQDLKAKLEDLKQKLEAEKSK